MLSKPAPLLGGMVAQRWRVFISGRWQRAACQAFGMQSPAVCFHRVGRRNKSITRRPLAIVAVIDGDVASAKIMQEFMSGLRQHGRIVGSKFFAAPGRLENKKWRDLLSSNSTEFIPVARGSNPSQDPTDVAIYGEAQKLLEARQVDVVAMLVEDVDYIPLVQEIIAAGKRCVVSCQRPRTAWKFEEAGAQLLHALEVDSLPEPKYACILRGDGSGDIEELPPFSKTRSKEYWKDESWISSKLSALNYLCDTGDPILPSMAKFWFGNSLGDLMVYPGLYTTRSVARLFRERPSAKWAPHRQDLAFIFPVAEVGQVQWARAKYGSRRCARFVRGGGPFIMRDSSRMVEEILLKMGFVDDSRNQCLEEGLDVFASLTTNARAIRKSGIRIGDYDTTFQKIEKVRQICLSSSCHGLWQTPPRDGCVREHLLAQCVLQSVSASSDEVFCAMASCAISAGVTPKKTYFGRVMQANDILFHRLRHPTSRH